MKKELLAGLLSVGLVVGGSISSTSSASAAFSKSVLAPQGLGPRKQVGPSTITIGAIVAAILIPAGKALSTRVPGTPGIPEIAGQTAKTGLPTAIKMFIQDLLSSPKI